MAGSFLSYGLARLAIPLPGEEYVPAPAPYRTRSSLEAHQPGAILRAGARCVAQHGARPVTAQHMCKDVTPPQQI
jgi:hypothetical protein